MQRPASAARSAEKPTAPLLVQHLATVSLHQPSPHLPEIGEGATQTIEFVWPVAPLKVTVVDQNGLELPDTLWFPLFHLGNSLRNNGESVMLPVTEDPAAPPIQGDLADGYLVDLRPGRNGLSGDGFRRHCGR